MGIVHAKVDPQYRVDVQEAPEVVVEEEVLRKASFPLNEVKARVDRVNVDGLKRTKDDVVKGTVDDLFKAKDFEDVIVRAQKVRDALDNLGCFRNVCVFIDISSGPDATPDGLEVTFQVREKSRMVGEVNTTFGEDEGNVVIGLNLPNIWGRGERAQAAYSLGYRNTCSFYITGTKPLHLKPLDPVLSSSVFQQYQEYPWSGYRLLDRGVRFNVGFKTSPTTRHKLQWEGLIREMSVISKTSFPVRESSGPHLKSTLRHTITVDQRDDAVYPTHGLWLLISNEVAGIGGSVANLKSEVHVQANQSISKDYGVVLQTTGAFGILHDIYGTMLPDHFFLGGPTTLRGFQTRGVGPQVEGQSLGGRIYWSSGVHVYTPLPLPGAQEGLFNMTIVQIYWSSGVHVYTPLPLPGAQEGLFNMTIVQIYWSSGVHVYTPLPLPGAQEGLFNMTIVQIYWSSGVHVYTPLPLPGAQEGLFNMTIVQIYWSSGVHVYTPLPLPGAQEGLFNMTIVQIYWSSGVHVYTPLPLPGAQEGLFNMTIVQIYWSSGVHVYTPLPLPGAQEGLFNMTIVQIYWSSGVHVYTPLPLPGAQEGLFNMTIVQIYWSSGVHVYTPLPLPGAQEGLFNLMKTHLFLNAGCLAFEERPESNLSSLAPLLEARVACGAGVCLKIGRSARVEINYVMPLKAYDRDAYVKGLQFGVGANFL